MTFLGKSDVDGSTWDHFLTKVAVTVTLAGGLVITLPPLIPLAWAAYLLCSHPRTIDRMVRKGKLRGHKPANKTLIVTESIQELLTETEIQPSAFDDDDEADDDFEDTYPAPAMPTIPPFPRLARKSA